MVEEQINSYLAGPLTTSDGYTGKVEYASFESLFKETLLKKMNDSYQMKDLLQRTVKNRIDELFQKQVDAIMKKLKAELTQ